MPNVNQTEGSRGPRRPSSSSSSSSGVSSSWRYTGLGSNTVKALQRKLGIPADGIYGPQTRNAVMAYQRRNGLKVDGIAGPQTLGRLGLAARSSGGGRSAPRSAPSSGRGGRGGGAHGGGGGAPGGGGGGAPAIDEQKMAAKYGMALAVINSDPELKKLFNDAIANDWTTEEFVARARNTGWYQRNSESARQAIILKLSDPATWKQRMDQTRAMLSEMAWSMGAQLGPEQLESAVEQALTFGWNESQIRTTLAEYIKFGPGGNFLGRAAQTETELKEFARAMGVRVSDGWFLEKIKAEAKADGSGLQTGLDELRQMAISAFPHLAERLQAGETVAQIADPYRQSMAQLLELNPESLDVFDNTIRSALSGRNAQGQPEMKSLWQFEVDLRKDPRWMKTKNAREQGAAVARQILTDFGLAS